MSRIRIVALGYPNPDTHRRIAEDVTSMPSDKPSRVVPLVSMKDRSLATATDISLPRNLPKPGPDVRGRNLSFGLNITDKLYHKGESSSKFNWTAVNQLRTLALSPHQSELHRARIVLEEISPSVRQLGYPWDDLWQPFLGRPLSVVRGSVLSVAIESGVRHEILDYTTRLYTRREIANFKRLLKSRDPLAIKLFKSVKRVEG